MKWKRGTGYYGAFMHRNRPLTKEEFGELIGHLKLNEEIFNKRYEFYLQSWEQANGPIHSTS